MFLLYHSHLWDRLLNPLLIKLTFCLNIEIVGSHALLQQENPEYDLKRQKLYEYYHPLEIDPAIPLDEKAKLMEEWYETLPVIYMEITTLFCYATMFCYSGA